MHKHALRMNKLVCAALVTAAVWVASVASSQAQSNNKVIEFPKQVVTEKFTLPAGDGITYIVTAYKDNLLKFSVGGSYVDGVDAQGLEITLAKLDNHDKILATASPGEEIEYQAKSDGEYVITVMNPGTKRAKISARISLNE